MDLHIPDDVVAFIRQVFSTCISRLASDLSTFPSIHVIQAGA